MSQDMPEEKPAPEKEVEIDTETEREEINLDPNRKTGNDGDVEKI